MPEPELLKADELARLLRVGRRQCYLLIKQGQIPGVIKLNGSIRISRFAVEQWLHGADNGTEEKELANGATPPDTSEEAPWRASPSS